MRQAFTIVFNGSFTLEQCIRNAMPVLDRYVVVEGATHQLQKLAQDHNGRSTDGTNEILDRLCLEFPDKLVVYRSKWCDKLEMCNAALREMKHGLIWQLDCDEFYFQTEMVSMMDYMDANPEITEAEFWGYHFFGGFEWHTRLEEGAWGNNPPWRRLFRWSGERWASHTPPRFERLPENVLTRDVTRQMAMLYHYGYCWHRQVYEKLLYHDNTLQSELMRDFTRMIHTGKHPNPNHLVPFEGRHPINVRKFEP